MNPWVLPGRQEEQENPHPWIFFGLLTSLKKQSMGFAWQLPIHFQWLWRVHQFIFFLNYHIFYTVFTQHLL